MEKERPKIGLNIFVIRDNKLLLGKRKNVVGDGYWGLPGGHFEWMESLVAGAKRELKEETGLTVDKLIFLHIINDPRPGEDKQHYVHIDFLAEGILGEPKNMEPKKCYGWKWFDLNVLPPENKIFIGHRKSILAFLGKTVFID